jgi:hypothetical protein
MNVNEINAYLQRAREIIGDRTQAEIDYDNAVVAYLSAGMDIKRLPPYLRRAVRSS